MEDMDIQPVGASSYRDLDDLVDELLPQLRGTHKRHEVLLASESHLENGNLQENASPSFLSITFDIKPFKTVEAASSVEIIAGRKQGSPHGARSNLSLAIAIGCLIILVLIDLGQRYKQDADKRHVHNGMMFADKKAYDHHI